MKKYLLIIIFALSSLCQAGVTSPEKLTVILDWFPNPDHAPLIIAKQQGFFKEQGLDVDLIGPADPNDPPKLVAAHKADLGITYQPQFLEQVDRGLPLICIGSLIDKPLNSLVALKSSNIKTMADLKGKRIGTTSGGLSSVMLNVILNNAGLTAKDVEIINVKYNLTQALLSKKVDAVTGVMRNYEIPLMETKQHHLVTFFPEDNGIPNYSELVFITNNDQVKDKRFPRFLAAIKKAVEYLDEHPEESWKLFSKAYPESNNAVNHDVWFATLPYFSEDPASIDMKDWMQFANFMKQHHMITKVQPSTRYALMLNYPSTRT